MRTHSLGLGSLFTVLTLLGGCSAFVNPDGEVGGGDDPLGQRDASDGEGASCAVTLCSPDTYCDDISGTAKCLPLPSCAAVSCETGNECQLVDVQCVRAPCPPQPQCVPVGTERPCNLADCAEGTYCDDISGEAKCLPLPSCAAVTCEVGSQCELVQVQCIRAPCPPQPQCVAAPTGCATVRCKSGYHCEEVEVQCIRAPCPPLAECVPN